MLGSTSESEGALLGAAAITLVDRGRVRFEVPKDDRRDTRRREYMAEVGCRSTEIRKGEIGVAWVSEV